MLDFILDWCSDAFDTLIDWLIDLCDIILAALSAIIELIVMTVEWLYKQLEQIFSNNNVKETGLMIKSNLEQILEEALRQIKNQYRWKEVQAINEVMKKIKRLPANTYVMIVINRDGSVQRFEVIEADKVSPELKQRLGERREIVITND